MHFSERHNRHRSLERRSSSGDRTSMTPDSLSPCYSAGQSPLQTPTGARRKTHTLSELDPCTVTFSSSSSFS